MHMPGRIQAVPALMIALLVSGLSASAQGILTPAQARGKKILLVAGEPEKGETNDDGLVKKHFEELGYIVTMAGEDDPASKADGQDLVVISSTADSRVIADKYTGVTAPVFTWN